jgi:hypothetical protein
MAYFVGGPLAKSNRPVSSWQRVYRSQPGTSEAARYIRLTLEVHRNGLVYQLFAWDGLDERQALIEPLGDYRRDAKAK